MGDAATGPRRNTTERRWKDLCLVSDRMAASSASVKLSSGFSSPSDDDDGESSSTRNETGMIQ